MYVKVSDMNLSENNPIICSSKNFLNQKDVGRNDFVLRYSIIFPKRGGAIFTNKRRKILTDNVVIDTNIMSMTPYIKEMIDYLYLWLQIMNLKKIYTGTSVPQINNQDIYPLLFPLPPLAEQKRIVAKLEELMPLIERYDAAEKKLSALDKEFPDKLRKSILQQAIQGKLTEQLSSDGDSRDLLEKIRAEKAKLIAVGKIRKEKPLPPIKDDEKPFDIPDSWQWVRLGEIGETNIGLTYSPENISDDGVIVLRSGNIQNGKIDYANIVKVNLEIPKNKLCRKGDILERVGKVQK